MNDNRMTFLGGGRSCIGFKFSELEMSACPQFSSSLIYIPMTPSRTTEVVLTVMLERMRFTPSKKVLWKLNGIAQPSVDDPGYDSNKPELPIKVESLA